MSRKRIDVEEQLRRVAQLGPDFQQVVALAQLGRVVQAAMAQVGLARQRTKPNAKAKGGKPAAVRAAAAAAGAAIAHREEP